MILLGKNSEYFNLDSAEVSLCCAVGESHLERGFVVDGGLARDFGE
jgi:hypothetical protein